MKKRLELCGWVLFLTGIVIWVIQSIMAKDILGMLAATTWLVGCSIFILAHMIKGE